MISFGFHSSEPPSCLTSFYLSFSKLFLTVCNLSGVYFCGLYFMWSSLKNASHIRPYCLKYWNNSWEVICSNISVCLGMRYQAFALAWTLCLLIKIRISHSETLIWEFYFLLLLIELSREEVVLLVYLHEEKRLTLLCYCSCTISLWSF